MALATVAALPMFVFENPNSPGAATEVAAAAAPERAPDLDSGASSTPVVTDTVDDALAETVEDAVSVVPDDAGVGASSGMVSLDTARLESEGMAEQGRLFEVEALALAAEVAEAEFATRQVLHVFLEAKQAEAERQEERTRLRTEEEDRRFEAIATPGPTTTIPSDTTPDEVGPTAEQWEALRYCEASGSYGAISPTGNYRGAYQFGQVTWDWIAGIYHPRLVGLDPAQVAPADQDVMAQSLYDLRGRGQWPVCGRYLP